MFLFTLFQFPHCERVHCYCVCVRLNIDVKTPYCCAQYHILCQAAIKHVFLQPPSDPAIHNLACSMRSALLLLVTAVAFTTAINQVAKRNTDRNLEEAIVQYTNVLSRLLEKVRTQGEMESLLDRNLEEAMMQADIQKRRGRSKKRRKPKARRRDDDRDDDEDSSSSSSDDKAAVEEEQVLSLVQDLLSGLMGQ